jgi:hypothetical protein
MRRPFLMGVMIIIVSLTSCSSLEDINNNTSKLNTHSEVRIVEEERVVEEVPSQLKGYIEDEALRVSILAEIDADEINYKTNIVFSNKTGKSLDLIFDCGLLISNDKFASSMGESCLAVESMLLKKNNKYTTTIILPNEFFGIDNKMVTVRYRQDKLTKDLQIQL